MSHTPRIGCIGQGYIGKNYADNFEARGYAVVRYALEEPYRANKDEIRDCDIVFIAVPTPTTPEGFDASIVRASLALVGKGKTAVVKSTILPGTTEALQNDFPDIVVLHSPEFLRESNAAKDAAEPDRNLIGVPDASERARQAAEAVLAVLPPAPYARIMTARDAELVKYAGNTMLMLKVVYANLLYDLAGTLGIDYDVLREALGADPRIGPSHLSVISASGHSERAGRGAGGHCFIKDFAALRDLYASELPEDASGIALLDAVARKNIELLRASGKDLDLLTGVYGADV